jgi:hypothetical protein
MWTTSGKPAARPLLVREIRDAVRARLVGGGAPVVSADVVEVLTAFGV